MRASVEQRLQNELDQFKQDGVYKTLNYLDAMLEKQKARQSMFAYIIFWVVSLLILFLVMNLYHSYM